MRLRYVTLFCYIAYVALRLRCTLLIRYLLHDFVTLYVYGAIYGCFTTVYVAYTPHALPRLVVYVLRYVGYPITVGLIYDFTLRLDWLR